MKAFFIIALLACFFGAGAQGFGFIAKKDYKTEYYSIGTPLRIKLQNDSASKVKGYFSKATSDGIYLAPFNNNDTTLRFVPLTHIQMVVPLQRRARKKIAYAAGAGLALSGILIAAAGISPLRNPIGYILILPAFASAAIVFYALPVVYAKEFFDKKSIRRGWTFVTR